MSWLSLATLEVKSQVKHLSSPPSLLHSHDLCTKLRSKLRGACPRCKRTSDTLRKQKSKEGGKIADSVEQHAKTMGSPSQWWHIWQFEVNLLVLHALLVCSSLQLPTTSSNNRLGVRTHHGWDDPLFHACTHLPPLLCDSVCHMKLISSAPDPQPTGPPVL